MSDDPPPIRIPEDNGADSATDAGSQQVTSDVIKAVSRATLEFHQGPLPSPEQLEKYDNILPGAATWFFSQVEKEANHRRTMESLAIRNEGSLNSRGQILAFLLSVVVLVGGLVLLYLGKPIGGLAGVVTACAWTSITLLRRRRGGRERLPTTNASKKRGNIAG